MIRDLTVREAGITDLQALFEAHLDSVKNLCAGAYSQQQLAVWFEGRSPEIYRPAIEAHQIWLAERQGRVLGFVGFVPGEVTLLFVRKEASGLGLGKHLFKLGLAKAESGFTGSLTVVATQNSQPFYQNHGFLPVEDLALVRGKAEIKIKVVRMERVLAAVGGAAIPVQTSLHSE